MCINCYIKKKTTLGLKMVNGSGGKGSSQEVQMGGQSPQIPGRAGKALTMCVSTELQVWTDTQTKWAIVASQIQLLLLFKMTPLGRGHRRASLAQTPLAGTSPAVPALTGRKCCCSIRAGISPEFLH